jgi:dTDP-glucose 4,6-dehydratase
MKKKILITGGAGFIGSHVLEHLAEKTGAELVVVDKLNYSCKGWQRLEEDGLDKHPRVKLISWDLCMPFSSGIRKEIGEVDIIIHMAAESHVDRSIDHPLEFVTNNVNATVNLLEYARGLKNLENFFYFSTDEVFGPALNDSCYKEWDRHKPTNPYSASKSAAEGFCVAYENTYQLPVMIINNMNVFGERQHVEKFIPMTIKKVLNDEQVLIHSHKDKKTAGTRFYIHARNVAAAILFLLEKGTIGEKYHVVGEQEVSNLEMAQAIADIMGKKLDYKMVDFHSDRPGHDLRYCLEDTKMNKLGWKLPVSFMDSLENTIKWTLRNQQWLEE